VSVGAICVRSVQIASPDETVRAVTERMAHAGVGTVVVLDGDRRPVGILTDRDVTLRCVARRRDPDTTDVRDVMTHPVTCVAESMPIEQALGRMVGAHARRLAVVDDGGRLVGILALDDVLELLAEEAAAIGTLLRQGAGRRR
jgi:CBS domain-containing protein